MTNATESTECLEAISLGAEALQRASVVIADYKLVAVANAIAPRGKVAPAAWRLTYKRRALIPASADTEIGKGGELHVEVNLTARSARITGRGE